MVAVEEDLGLDDRAQAGGCFDELKREREREENKVNNSVSVFYLSSTSIKRQKETVAKKRDNFKLTLRDRAVAGQAVGSVLEGDVGRTGRDRDGRAPLAEAGALFLILEFFLVFEDF